MNTPTNESKHCGDKLARELGDMRERIRVGVKQADAGLLIPAVKVFAELRERNAAISGNPR